MAVIIDRRLNPSGKNHLNRQRFLERAKGRIKEAVEKTVSEKGLKDIVKGADNVKVRSKDVSEPSFHHDPTTGTHKRVLPGNDQYTEGDTIPKSKSGGGKGNGKQSGDGDTIDDFQFTLTREEFLNYLFDDLELPDFIKESIATSKAVVTSRAGLTNYGSPANLNLERTFKKSMGRRMALRRPSDQEILEVEEQIGELIHLLENCDAPKSDPCFKQWETELAQLREELDRLNARRKIIPYIDENDLKYNLWQQNPKHLSQAVMFCLMDVSGSMGEIEKDISKRFFLILYLFLERKYEKIDIRFIRHTTRAEEVDEQKFFHDTLSGGTTISSGLELINDIIEAEYNVDEWNIYVAQCTDGDNSDLDNRVCRYIIENKLLPKLQYFAYIQVDQYERSTYYTSSYSAWPLYQHLSDESHKVVAKKVTDKSEVWTLFRALFAKNRKEE